jgi:hypothetical protein
MEMVRNGVPELREEIVKSLFAVYLSALAMRLRARAVG